MAERKAQQKWFPPDFDWKKHGSANKYQNTHHLRERARKIDQGILIVRFELPFNIWCLGCNNHVGMGVRYNAEKKMVGSYYSTKIFEFRMKCHLCDNYFTIKTDPQNLDYAVESGARRQDKRWNAEDSGQIVTDEKDKIDKLASDSMFKLEHLAEDRNKLLRLVPTLERLEDFQENRWKDDYASNQNLRKIFRTRRNELKLKAKEDEKLLSKCGSELLIEDEDVNDVKLAKLLKLNSRESPEELKRKKRSDIMFDSIGLQQSTLHSYLNKKDYKTPELKGIAKTIVRKSAEHLKRDNLKASLRSVKKLQIEREEADARHDQNASHKEANNACVRDDEIRTEDRTVSSDRNSRSLVANYSTDSDESD